MSVNWAASIAIPGSCGFCLVDALAEVARRLDDLEVLGQRQEPQRDGPAGLAEAQHISLAALLEVEVGELEAVERAGHRLEPLPAFDPSGSLVASRHRLGCCAAADAAAQLMELADAEPVGVHHDHHRRVGHVDADLDHGGAHQDVDLAGAERGHHRVLLVGGQPAVHQPEPQPGQRPVPQLLEQLDAPWSPAARRVLAVGVLSFSSMRDATT